MKNEVIRASILKSILYSDYLTLINSFAKAYKTSGFEQSKNHVEYTKLNASRMRRIERSVQFSDEQLAPFRINDQKQTWLVITETWCGDGGQIIPVLNKITENIPRIDLRIVFRDENRELMDLFLTNESRSIPKLILLNEDFEVVNTWGPRPEVAAKMVADYKLRHGVPDAEFKAELQRWYNEDKGNGILKDLTEIVSKQAVL